MSKTLRCVLTVLACGLMAGVLLCTRTARGPGQRRLRGVQRWDLAPQLKSAAADVLHEAASAAVALGITEEDEGTPAKQINTTSSGEQLVEELLSNKKLTHEVRLTPVEDGWIREGRIYDIFLKDANVGQTTHVALGDKNDVRFVVTDLNVDVECKYDLRLTCVDFGETGRVVAKLTGSQMTLQFPQQGVGPGSCEFAQGLDLDIREVVSDRDAINVEIGNILRGNLMGIRSEIVRSMEDGLCRNLLAPSMGGTSGLNLPMAPAQSMWPLVIGSVLALILLLCGAFFLGRCSVQDWSRSHKVKRSLGPLFSSEEDEETGSESCDSIRNSNSRA
ncbi:Uncharacterized protein SCF082_LOCUS48991 [Durusdinium trenchii]|uniref:Uncharacterized protein n=1 Tax=Durusdinium trenchii TaxID=1381693 RepID=A0ABP0RXZ2_9DINO